MEHSNPIEQQEQNQHQLKTGKHHVHESLVPVSTNLLERPITCTSNSLSIESGSQSVTIRKNGNVPPCAEPGISHPQPQSANQSMEQMALQTAISDEELASFGTIEARQQQELLQEMQQQEQRLASQDLNHHLQQQQEQQQQQHQEQQQQQHPQQQQQQQQQPQKQTQEEDPNQSILMNGMNLHLSLVHLHEVIQGADKLEALEINKRSLLVTFTTNVRNIELLSVSLADLQRCHQTGFLSKDETMHVRQRLIDAFMTRAMEDRDVQTYIAELGRCIQQLVISQEEYNHYSYRLYGRLNFTEPSVYSSSGFADDSLSKQAINYQSQMPQFSPQSAQNYASHNPTDPSGNGLASLASIFQMTTNAQNPASFSSILVAVNAGSPLSQAQRMYAQYGTGTSTGTTGGAYSVLQGVQSVGGGVGKAPSSPKKSGKVRDPNNPTKRRPKPTPDPAKLEEQLKRMSLPLPDVIPEQVAPPANHRGFGASAKPFNHDGSVEMSESRKRWRCQWCYCSGRFTPALRKGPCGSKSLCNSCGMWYSRHGYLPDERYREFIKSPSGFGPMSSPTSPRGKRMAMALSSLPAELDSASQSASTDPQTKIETQQEGQAPQYQQQPAQVKVEVELLSPSALLNSLNGSESSLNLMTVKPEEPAAQGEQLMSPGTTLVMSQAAAVMAAAAAAAVSSANSNPSA